MITFIQWLWPRSEVRRLKEQCKTLSEQAKSAEDKYNVLESRLFDALKDAKEARAETLNTVKRVVNVQMYAAGSQAPMFEDVGPSPAPRKQFKPEELAPVGGRNKAGQTARSQRASFLEQFIESERAKVAATPYASPAEDVFEGAFNEEAS